MVCNLQYVSESNRMLDTTLGIDNTGFLKFDCDIEMRAGTFNTSNSNLWTKLQRVFATQIEQEYAKMRQANFTEENLMKYLYGEQISQIPQRNYNQDMQTKYLNFGNQFLHACHGNGYSHMKRWVRERLFFLDTLLNYTVSSSDYITIRANKQGAVYLDIQTYVPMYARVKWRDEANNTGTQIKKINRGETVRFTYTMPTATDQEVIVYGGKYLKDVGDLSNLQPTTLLISKAPKLTRLICTNNPNLINTDLSNCTMLQEIDLHGCTKLGGGIGSNPTLNVQKCTNLKTINIYDTQLTAIYTNTSGGNIEEINYPFTVQTVQLHNQPNLKSIGIPVHYVANGNRDNRFATSLVSVDIANCTGLETMVKNYYEVNGKPVEVPTFLGVSSAQSFSISNSLTHLEKIDLSYCANLRSLSISDFYQLKEINFDDICSWDATYSNLSDVTIRNCPNVETVTFNQKTVNGANSLGVAFAKGTTLDFSGLMNLKHIRSNVGIKGLKTIILPLSIMSLVFDFPSNTAYSQQFSDVENIWSYTTNHVNDEFTGIDLLDIDTITDFSMGSLNSIERVENLNLKITNTFPYFNYHKTSNFCHPVGRIDISDYTDNLAHLFKGVDLDKLEIVCTKPLTQSNASYMFSYTSCSNTQTIPQLFTFLRNITDLSYMFYHASILHAPTLPESTTDCRYMFYYCTSMVSTPSNWNNSYATAPISDYCYTGCTSIREIDGQLGTLDEIPVKWGGYERQNVAFHGETVEAENTLERELTTFKAKGRTLQNIVPEVAQTPTLISQSSSQELRSGLSKNILTIDGEMPKAELEGLTLVNLASEKRSGLLTANQLDNDIREGLSDVFLIDDNAPMHHVQLDGLTLVNIMPKTGKTPVVNNNDRTYEINKGLDEGIIIGNGKMLSSKLHGETMVNLASETIPTDSVSVGYKQSCRIGADVLPPIEVNYTVMDNMMIHGNSLKNLVSDVKTTGDLTFYGKVNTVPDINPIIIQEGDIVSGEMRGYTFENKVPTYGQSEQVTITGSANVADLVSNSANGVCALDKNYKKPKKIFYQAVMKEV